MIAVGDLAPDFTLSTDEGSISLSSLRGKTVVVYFYPKDSTSGCTKEACDFRDNYARFKKVGEVIGISKDSVKSHQKFKAAQSLPFPLAADVDGAVCARYGVWVEKSMYGRKYFGIERATFVIDKTGCITHIWRKVKVPGHVEAVLKAVS